MIFSDGSPAAESVEDVAAEMLQAGFDREGVSQLVATTHRATEKRRERATDAFQQARDAGVPDEVILGLASGEYILFEGQHESGILKARHSNRHPRTGRFVRREPGLMPWRHGGNVHPTLAPRQHAERSEHPVFSLPDIESPTAYDSEGGALYENRHSGSSALDLS